LLENRVAVDLITTDKLGLPGERCLGALILQIRAVATSKTLRSRFRLLASVVREQGLLY